MEAEGSTMFQGVAKASAAFRLMQQMGWAEGSGLGKNLQGMKEHLKVKKKDDCAGIGLDMKMKAQANWALNTMAYDKILQSLKVVAAQASRDDNEGDDSEDDMTEAKREEEVEVKVLKVTRPQGRYKKREQGKKVGDYSKTDLAAILGAMGGKTVIKETTQQYQSNKIPSVSINSNVAVDECSVQVVKEANSESVEETAAPVSKKASTSEKKQKSQVKIVEETKVEDPVEVIPEFPELPVDWWGNKYGFVRAGGLGATSEAKSTERSAFCEQDQEDLYKLVQDKATTGKQGLGIGDRKPRKVGGADWKGQKKVLDSGSDEEGELDERTGNDDDTKTDVTHVECENSGTRKRKSKSENTEKADAKYIEKTKSKKAKKAGCENVLMNGSDGKVAAFDIELKTSACDGNLETSPHWKKVCKQLLAEAPSQTLSFKKLQKRVIAAGLFNQEVQLEERMASLKQKLQKSSRFVVDGKNVTLSSVKVGA